MKVEKPKISWVEGEKFTGLGEIRPFSRADFLSGSEHITAMVTRLNMKAWRIFEKIRRRFNGKVVRKHGEDFEYARLELELLKCGWLGELLSRFIELEFQEVEIDE